ncbi:MAG: aromatic ring-hydroxylating dioxygenase subunit alpha [Rhizobiaceae bacterium]
MSLHLSPSDPYTGLREATESLPATDYFTAEAFQRDLDTIWFRNWLMVCRSADMPKPLDFRTFRVGGQEGLLVRDENGVLQAFHNTCRHRGSALCREEQGRLKARLITCPYHAWSYSLRGDLVRVPSKVLPAGFDKDDHPLYRVALEEWRGFVFINLDPAPKASVRETFDAGSVDLGNWPLEGLVTGHSFRKLMNCNWKIFWENFNECLHCPGVHKHLSALVPIYGRGLMARHDDPDWASHADDASPQYAGTLRNGAESWSADGAIHAVPFPDLSEKERAAGQSYAAHLPSMFVVGHADYVRTVRLLPFGPAQTELVAEWLFLPETLERDPAELQKIYDFALEVLGEDADVCELNQRGISARPHKAGVLMPEEYELRRFHQWVQAQHARTN